MRRTLSRLVPSGLSGDSAKGGGDPRPYQIAVLATLLVWGTTRLSFPIAPMQIAAILATALGTQAIASRAVGIRFDPLSPWITGLGLSLLLRFEGPGPGILAAVVAIGSKFVLRVRGRHVWNPGTLGIAAALLATERAWLSPGQWGSGATFALAVAAAGGLVLYRARVDITVLFLAMWATALFARAAYLGDPFAIPLRQLESGTLVVFAFFMISDPKTIPDRRAGRAIFAAVVVAIAFAIRFGLWRENGLIWALVLACPLVPWINRVLPGKRYAWRGAPRGGASRGVPPMNEPRPFPLAGVRALAAAFVRRVVAVPRIGGGFRRRAARRAAATFARRVVAVSTVLALCGAGLPVSAFCGFYVARADTRLFNEASKVVLVRDGDRTVLTMANDYRGDPKEFALVVPVPTFITEDQIHVADMALIDHLDAYTAPRLVEYFDDDPCLIRREYLRKMAVPESAVMEDDADRARQLGVTVEATYTVGEYDISILSAEESRGLETWLRESGYRIPKGASEVLGSYLRQGLRFFVARVNLGERERLGVEHLRPLQVAYESPRFVLPIRLGTVNSKGDQELYVFALTSTGRVETTNYRTVRMPSNVEIPTFVKDDFASFYRAMFERQVEKENRRAVFLEYAWDMAWCDPCAADPLSREQLRELGVFWLDDATGAVRKSAAQNVFVTRLHVRYDAVSFPEDLRFQETGDRTNFQGRYVVRHPWAGERACGASDDYRRTVAERREREARTLASLTGWELADIRGRMDLRDPVRPERPWWKRIWS